MSRPKQLFLIIVVVLALAAVLDRFIAWQFKIFSVAGNELHFGDTTRPRIGFAAGSSLTFYGIAWNDVARAVDAHILSYAVPGGSVREMEVLYRKQPKAICTFIGISAYDINENHISNFRSQIVPFREEVANLWNARADWKHTKEVLAQYPMYYVRAVFPTAGQYGAVMVKIREILRAIFRTQAPKPPAEGAVITDKSNSQTSTIADWTAPHLLRTVVDGRAHGGGNFEFHSTKRQSLFRFIHQGLAQGKVVVIVMPESPVYNAEFFKDDIRRPFEELLAEAQKEAPAAVWVRIDQVPELNSNQSHWDLVHLNAQGQTIATQVLLEKLKAAGLAP